MVFRDFDSPERVVMKRLWAILIVMMLASCSRPAKYVVVADDLTALDGQSPHQRYVCLANQDARTHSELLGLKTKSAVQKYGEARGDRHDPVEDVLFHLISEDYHGAAASLSDNGDRIPEYLRLTLRADLAWEGEGEPVDARRLVHLYQEALDAETCAINREIINLRIRQLRYQR